MNDASTHKTGMSLLIATKTNFVTLIICICAFATYTTCLIQQNFKFTSENTAMCWHISIQVGAFMALERPVVWNRVSSANENGQLQKIDKKLPVLPSLVTNHWKLRSKLQSLKVLFPYSTLHHC